MKDWIVIFVENMFLWLNMEYFDLFLLYCLDLLMEEEEVVVVFDVLFDSGKVKYFGVLNMSGV